MLQFYSNIINNTLVSSNEEWFSFQKEYLDTHSRIDISQLSIENIDFSS